VIGLDTNVLLRLLLDDDAAQGTRITKLFDAHVQAPGSAHIADVVLAEAMWTLGSAYQQPKAALVKALQALLGQPAYAFESRAAVEQALQAYTSSRAGFSDCLIVAKNTALGCTFTATFDRALRALPAAKLI